MKLRRALLPLVVLSLVVAACAGDDAETTTTTTAAETTTTTAAEPTAKVCEVTDVGGVDDRSFNQSAWEGALRAGQDFGVETKVLESNTETDYEPNINSLIDEGCDLIVTVGFLLGDATGAAAEANPDQKFAIVDFAYDPEYDNVQGHVYTTAEGAFLAGYLAAGMTQTGTVATYGGIDIGGPVTDFMDGFVWGVRYHNQEKGTDVEVLGWNPDTKEGLFTGNFDSIEDARTLSVSLADEGADIFLPVGGQIGQGSAALAQERGDMWVFGVDSDWFLSVPQFSDVILSSVLKKIDVSVYQASEQVVNGTFQGGTVLNTMATGGIDLAPFHDHDAVVPDEMKTELADLKQQIIDGTLDIVISG